VSQDLSYGRCSCTFCLRPGDLAYESARRQAANVSSSRGANTWDTRLWVQFGTTSRLAQFSAERTVNLQRLTSVSAVVSDHLERTLR